MHKVRPNIQLKPYKMNSFVHDMRIRSILLAAGLSLAATSALADHETTFGAIAYSQDSGAYASTWGHATRKRAEEAALASCTEVGPGCEVVMWARDACAAIATAPGYGYGTEWDDERGMSEIKALEACLEYNDTCSILTSMCTDQPPNSPRSIPHR